MHFWWRRIKIFLNTIFKRRRVGHRRLSRLITMKKQRSRSTEEFSYVNKIKLFTFFLISLTWHWNEKKKLVFLTFTFCAKFSSCWSLRKSSSSSSWQFFFIFREKLLSLKQLIWQRWKFHNWGNFSTNKFFHSSQHDHYNAFKIPKYLSTWCSWPVVLQLFSYFLSR